MPPSPTPTPIPTHIMHNTCSTCCNICLAQHTHHLIVAYSELWRQRASNKKNIISVTRMLLYRLHRLSTLYNSYYTIYMHECTCKGDYVCVYLGTAIATHSVRTYEASYCLLSCYEFVLMHPLCFLITNFTSVQYKGLHVSCSLAS